MNRTLIAASSILVSIILLAGHPGFPQVQGPTANPKIRMIVVKEEATAQKVMEELKGGEAFPSLARKYSVGPNAEQGGYIGTISSSELEGDLRDAVIGLRVGEVSRIIKTKLGYTMVQITTDEYFKAGLDYYRMGEYEKAVRNLNQDVKINPDSALSHLYLGMAHSALGNLDEAITSYRRAIDINPNMAETYYNLANALKRRGDRDEAASMYIRAIEISPDFASAHNNLAWLYAEQGIQLDEGIEHAKEANRLSPNNPLYIETLAQLYFIKGEKEKAIEEIGRAIRLDFDNPYYRKQLAIMQGEVQPPETGEVEEKTTVAEEAPREPEEAEAEAAPEEKAAPETVQETAEVEEAATPPSESQTPSDDLKIQVLSTTDDKETVQTLLKWLEENNYPAEFTGEAEIKGSMRTTLYYQKGYKEKTLEIARRLKGEQDVFRQRSPSPYDIIIVVGDK